MTDENTISGADVFDASRRFGALAMLALSALFAIRALAQTTGPEGDRALRLGGYAVAVVLGVAVLSVVYLRLFRLPAGQSHLYFSADGFVTDTVRRALNVSWLATYLTLSALAFSWDAAVWRDFPVSFFLDAVLAVMLSVFGAVFFYLNRSIDENGSG